MASGGEIHELTASFHDGTLKMVSMTGRSYVVSKTGKMLIVSARNKVLGNEECSLPSAN